ncbi:MAG: TIGR01777 family oxidoreductase [Chitinophagaceae bacterium]
MPTVLITGGTGLIGRALSTLLLQKGYDVIIVTRGKASEKKATEKGLSYAAWDVAAQTIDLPAIKKADYIIHLAGAAVADKRWSAKRKREIAESRTQSSALLVKALHENSNQVKAVISASAIGWYGADPVIPNPNPFTEADAADPGFLGETCRLWEESIAPVALMGKRLVKLRTGIVLSKEGGALKEFIKPLHFGIASILGNGKQIISWIHIDDLCRMYLQALEDEKMEGAYNAVAPKPVSNKELTLQLAKAIKGSFYIPVHVPSVALKIILGELSIEILKSATVAASKIRSAGFNFIFPSIEAAVNELTRKQPT